jgi:hypothetical protein
MMNMPQISAFSIPKRLDSFGMSGDKTAKQKRGIVVSSPIMPLLRENSSCMEPMTGIIEVIAVLELKAIRMKPMMRMIYESDLFFM